MKKLSVLVVLLVVMCFQSLYAEWNVEVAYVSSYVWRGFDLYPKNKPALQPSLTYNIGKSGFSVNVFASFALTDRTEMKSLEEIDFTFNYAFNISENVDLSVGMINYGYYWSPTYTFNDNNSQEFYVTLGFPKVILSPIFSVYYDTNLGDGLYASATVGHSFVLTPKLNLDLNACLGYNGKQYIEESGISDLTITAELPLTAGKISITPGIHYTRVFLESLYRDDDKKDKLWIGVIFGIN